MNNEFDIAIVGMAGRFPGARNLDEFWQNLAGGVESITRLSDSDILESGVPAAYLSDPNYVKAAPILAEPGHFDAAFFGFSPMEARTMDPQHRLLLELAHEAVEHAGYDPDRQPGRVGVFAGSALNTYFTSAGLNRRLAEDYIPTLIGNDKDFLSTRISYKLNLKGPSMSIQTACSTSMVAVHLARQSLLSEETDMALAGAVSVRVPHRAGYFYDGGGVVSPDGQVRAFDAGANGTVFGSGGGILVLKRLADAVRDGDTVHAVIKGSAINNDGAEKAGYTAPGVNSQADAVIEALANAGVEADSISYLEAHGSGTPVGDPIEVRALTKAFRAFTRRSGYCALGSVKTNVGHLDAAAAVTGIIKTVLALKHRQLPPSLHFTEANPEIDFPGTPFFVNTQLRDWTSDGPRRAGVMSTGMGGTNAHIVLEEAAGPLTRALLADRIPPPSSGHPLPSGWGEGPGAEGAVEAHSAGNTTVQAGSPADGESESVAGAPHLLVLSAKTETALDAAARRLREFLERHAGVNMGDVAYTLQIGRKAFVHRRCLVCGDREDAIAGLGEQNAKRVLAGQREEARRPVVLLLPGIGDHYVGMAGGLYEAWEVFKTEVDRCAQILEPYLRRDIRKIIYPAGRSWKRNGRSKGIDLKQMLGQQAGTPEAPDARTLNQTVYAQPALFTIEYAMSRLWQSLGITPDAIVGHSMGEYVAACLAGVLSLEDALRLIATRARLVNELPQGAMLAVTLPEDELLPLLPAELSVSLINGPRLCVVAGPPDAVAGFKETLEEQRVICRHVQNAHAFHSRMLDSIVKAFEAEVKQVQLNEPSIPYISNVTGKWITRGEATNPAYWVAHANHTARFNDALHALWQLNNPRLLEAGPGRTLGMLALQHPDRPGRQSAGAAGRNGENPLAVSSIRHHYENQSDGEFLWGAIGRLWLAGAELEWANAHAGVRRRRMPLPTYPFEREHYWLEPVAPGKALETQQAGAGRIISRNPNAAAWWYVPSWKRVLPEAIGLGEPALQLEQSGAWLILADSSGFALALTDRLRSAGHDVVTVSAGSRFEQVDPGTFTIAPSKARDFDVLIRVLRENQALPNRIVHAWSVNGAPAAESDRDGFASAQALGFYSLLFLARALGAHHVGHATRLFVISSHVHEICGSETLRPEKSTLLGPCMVIRQEYPDIRVKSIDVDAPATAGDHEAAANLVLGEFLEADSSLFVAYRNARRWVQTFEPVRPSSLLPLPSRRRDATHDRPPSGMNTERGGVEDDPTVPGNAGGENPKGAPARPSFREGGVYLITGGLGRIGLAMSEYLAGKYRANLVLVGRSSLPERESWDNWIASHPPEDPVSSRIRALGRIEQLGGKVLVANASVADLSAMRGVIERAEQRFGKLNGVIHGAGIVGAEGYREIKDSDADYCERHFQAKARGLIVLEEALAGQPLDFCLLISSLTSVLGGIGQAAYAAANIFMDVFARRHNQKSTIRSAVPWLSVNWDVWRFEDHAAFDSAPGTTLKELGMNGEEAMRMLETALAMSAASQLVVSTGDLGARIDQWIKLESLNAQAPATAASPNPSAPSPPPGRPTNPDAPRDEIEQQVAQIWQQALGIDAIGIHDNFAQLGGHSLLAIRIVSELRRAFQIDLPVRTLFDAPTVAELSEYINAQLLADIEALTEEEARQLVSHRCDQLALVAAACLGLA